MERKGSRGRDLFVGDTLFAGSIGRTDLPGGDYETLMRSITEVLFPLGDDAIVHPGHGPDTTIGRERTTNPFVLEYLANLKLVRPVGQDRSVLVLDGDQLHASDLTRSPDASRAVCIRFAVHERAVGALEVADLELAAGQRRSSRQCTRDTSAASTMKSAPVARPSVRTPPGRIRKVFSGSTVS